MIFHKDRPRCRISYVGMAFVNLITMPGYVISIDRIEFFSYCCFVLFVVSLLSVFVYRDISRQRGGIVAFLCGVSIH